MKIGSKTMQEGLKLILVAAFAVPCWNYMVLPASKGVHSWWSGSSEAARNASVEKMRTILSDWPDFKKFVDEFDKLSKRERELTEAIQQLQKTRATSQEADGAWKAAEALVPPVK